MNEHKSFHLQTEKGYLDKSNDILLVVEGIDENNHHGTRHKDDLKWNR